MKTSIKGLLAVFLLIAAGSCSHGSAREHARITHLQSIALRPGVNKIEMLVPDGRAGMIVTATEPTGATLYLVMLPDNAGTGWTTVTTGTGDASLKADGVNTAVRFAKAWLDGSPETLMFTATRTAGAAPAGPATYNIVTYRLVTGRPGATPSGFEEVSNQRSSIMYSSADSAIADGIPVVR